mgnify:CR=1 FL=1
MSNQRVSRAEERVKTITLVNVSVSAISPVGFKTINEFDKENNEVILVHQTQRVHLKACIDLHSNKVVLS